MGLHHKASAIEDLRAEPRNDVHHRVRATAPDGRTVGLLLVNISASGLMARCEAPMEVGDRLLVQLPVLGATQAEVRWALGGRIGCRFDENIAPASYYALLAAIC